MSLNPLVCTCCGGTIDRSTMRCPYCGVQYEKKFDGVPITFVVDRPGVHTIHASCRLDDHMALRMPVEATEFALDKLRECIADGLLEYMRIDTEHDFRQCCRILHAQVKVIDPSWEG